MDGTLLTVEGRTNIGEMNDQPAVPQTTTGKTDCESGRSNKALDEHLEDSGISTNVGQAADPQLPSIALANADITLNAEQAKVFNLVNNGGNVFFTGCAGTGKSFLLRKIIQGLRERHADLPDAIAVTASTGIAACNIGGVTLHSFAGIGLGNEAVGTLVQRIRKSTKVLERWRKTKVLVIDEVSMIDGRLFDKLVEIAKTIKKNKNPFGGIQVVLTGDFFQLPPVTKEGPPKFTFDASFWDETVQNKCTLREVYRQTDNEFINMLSEMRLGRLDKNSVEKLKSLSRNVEYSDGVGATELYSHRVDVERANSARMRKLRTECRSFRAVDGGTIINRQHRERVLAGFLAPRDVVVKIDAQVMLIKNIDEFLVNGLVGHVIRFDAIGQDNAEGNVVDLPRKGGPKAFPVVRFVSGGITRETLVTPEIFKVELPSGEVLVSRTQIPIVLAWAMSIHKSQGLTLERVKVDLGKVFEKGQAYVALSRATSFDTLQVLNFKSARIMAHPKVVEWSEALDEN